MKRPVLNLVGSLYENAQLKIEGTILQRAIVLLEPHFASWLKFTLRFFLYVAVFIFLVYTLISLFFPYTLDYGEGPLLDQAARLANGQNIYRSDVSRPPYTISNYPPLYVLSWMPLVKLFGPAFATGRAISTLSALASATFLALTVRTLTQDRFAALVSGTLFLAIPYVVAWSGLARVDMLAMALSTAALYTVVRWRTSRRGMVFGGLLLVAAIYTRQSYALAAPLAAFVWLWTYERRRAVELALLVGGLVLVLFLVLNVLTGGGFFYNIVTANVNEFGMERLSDHLENLGGTTPILLILAGLFLFLAPAKRMPTWPLLVPYLVGASLSALTIGKIGSNINYFLELTAALSLIGGTLVFWSRQHRWRRNLLLILLVVQTGWFMQDTLNDRASYLAFRSKDPTTLRTLKERVNVADGPVLADEQMGMLTMQGQPLYIQPFEATQLARAGLWDQSTFLQRIENHEFPLILIYHFPFGPWHEERWTPEMLATIEEHYVSDGTMDGNVIYRPKGQVKTKAPPPVQRASFSPTDVQVGPLQRISQATFVLNPHITVNPTQPDHLAATVVEVTDAICDPPDCQGKLLLHTSTDGGATWVEQTPLDLASDEFGEGMASFGPDGTLYTLGLHRRMGVNRSYADSAALPYLIVPTRTVEVPSSQVSFEPWLQVDPRDEELLLVYSGRYKENFGINLKRSTRGEEWTPAFSVEPGVALADLEAGQATPPFGPQLLLGEGENLAIVWIWHPDFWRWPSGIFIATSNDNGMTFSQPRQIAETWSVVSATAHDGTYYVLYRWGSDQDQQLVLSTSQDGGTEWETVSVSGDLPLYSDWTKAPGVGVAPDGTIDVVFYAHGEDAAACAVELEDWRGAFLGGNWIDPCVYDVYYAYSEDGGQTFSQPLRLNETPIHGERFVRFSGFSMAGFRLAVASADDFAYPIWIETQGEEGTQAYTVRIER